MGFGFQDLFHNPQSKSHDGQKTGGQKPSWGGGGGEIPIANDINICTEHFPRVSFYSFGYASDYLYSTSDKRHVRNITSTTSLSIYDIVHTECYVSYQLIIHNNLHFYLLSTLPDVIYLVSVITCTEGAPIVQQDVSGRPAHDS